jgi:hypothetical protein
VMSDWQRETNSSLLSLRLAVTALLLSRVRLGGRTVRPAVLPS